MDALERHAPAIVPCGDRTVIVRLGSGTSPELNARVHGTAAVLRARRHPAITEVSPAYASLLVEYDPIRISWASLTQLLRSAADQSFTAHQGRTVEVPVLYGGEAGPDLEVVASHTALTADEVIRRHTGVDYRVYCLGFSPGFLYLGGLDPSLQVPRLDVPRTKVPVGSVAIGGTQTGIYPRESPGGWQLIGRSPELLFNPEKEPPSIAEPGDSIRFVPITAAEYERLLGQRPVRESAQPVCQDGQPGLRILSPGLATTVQDLGRRGFQAYGVPTGGAADSWPLLVGNWLLGNHGSAGALEATLLGPSVEFTGPTAFCITGAPTAATLTPAGGGSPRAVPMWGVMLAGPGDRLVMGASNAGCRSYLCVAGGFDLPRTLGSLSEDLLSGIGPFGRALRAGDWLPLGQPPVVPADLAGRRLPADAVPDYDGALTVRVTVGPQAEAFTDDGLRTFLSEEYTVAARSDRQGIRLEGAAIEHADRADILSEGMPPGAIQVPGNGQPLLALCNRGTAGGYTKIAVAIYPDMARAAQLRPGNRLRFARVDLAEAHAIAWSEARKLAQIRRYLRRPAGARTRCMLVRLAGVEFVAYVEEVTED